MRHIPNLLTVMRMLIIPFIPYTYIVQDNQIASIGLISIAAISDFLDGYLARRFQLVTDLGKVLDPLADKLLLIAIIFSLFFTQNFATGLLVAYLVIEVGMILSGALLYTRKERVVIAANIFGKVATALFFATALITIWFGYNVYVKWLFVLTLIFKITALISYIITFFQQRDA